MHPHSLSHLSDAALTRGLKESLRGERMSTNTALAHIAEFDSRQLYRQAGFPSMYVYCVEELHLAEGSALKRIRAARATNDYPQLFAMLADGRLHLSGLALLANHLTPENVDELTALSTHKSKRWIEELVAVRFPRRDLPERVRLLVPPTSMQVDGFLPSPGTVKNEPAVPSESQAASPPGTVVDPSGSNATPVIPTPADHAPMVPAQHPRITPLSPQRYGLQATVSESTHSKLRVAHELLGLPFGTGHIAEVLDRALDALLEQLEKRKLASTESPGATRSPATPRTIPAAVRRAVRARDGNQCTYTSDQGRRCPERSKLEYEHILPIARGGTSVVSNIRLLCRAHNQLEAERVFGREFMEHKRRVNSAPEARQTRH